MQNKIRKYLAVFTSLCTIAASLVLPDQTVQAAYSESEAAFLTFSEAAVTAKGIDSGYSIEGTAVTVNAAGTYVFSGSCADGSITVKKGTTGVKLVLNGLDLTSASATTGPILCKASTETEIVAENGTVNHLADSAANTEEKAAVKVNKQSSLVLSGTGTLYVNGVYKNGIKGGAETDITVKEQELHITAADNGLASDNTVTVKSGKLAIEAGGDGIKSSPDRVDDAGNEDDTVSLGDIILEGGEINITAQADGIQGDNSVTIEGGSYQITTNGGYTTALADDADSCKGIKTDSTLIINGGAFVINSADDALHSNEYISILGGTFDIQTGDDGMHADTSLIVGSEEEESDLDIAIRNCYEGLEAGTVYVNSGNVNINSTDDGVNAAGGNDGSGNNGRPGDGFNPWGGGPGGRPGGSTAESSAYATAAAGDSEYAIHISGGTLYVKAAGDGLDANGDIYISGGNIIVYGAAAGGPGSDNFPFDHDRTFAITGGYIFGAGSSQMEEGVQSSTQGYVVSNRNTYNQGTVISVVDSQGKVLFTEELAERVNYLMYSSPEMTTSGSYSFTTGETTPPGGSEGSGETTPPGGSGGSEETTPPEGTIYEKPSQVTGVSAVSAGTTKIKVTWKEVAGADGYLVYRYDNSKKVWTCVKTISKGKTASYSDSGLASGTSYKYRVCAYAADVKNVGDVSKTVTAATKPGKGNLKKATAKKGAITLKWKKTAGNGYEITYSTRKNFSGAKTIKVSGASKTSYTIKKLKSQKTYYVKIRAYTKVGSNITHGAYSARKKIKTK